MARDSRQRAKVATKRPWHRDYLHMAALVRTVTAHAHLARGRLLDVGCGNRPYEAWFAPHVDAYVGVDVLREVGRPDVLGVAWALPFRAASFDTVFSAQVLEHVERPGDALAEMARVLRPGGVLLLTAPQSWRVHEEPYDFMRFTRYGLQHLATSAGLEVEAVVAQGGAWTMVASAVNNAVETRIRPRVHRYVTNSAYLCSNVVFGLLERVWMDEGDASNHLLVARKPPASTRAVPSPA